METIYDLLENEGVIISNGNCWIIMYPDNDNKRRWHVFEHNPYTKGTARLYKGYDESEAVKVMED